MWCSERAPTKSAEWPLRAEIVPGPVEHPGAERVEPFDRGEIEDDAALVADGGEEIGDAALDRRRLIGGPAAGKRRAQLVADLVDRQLRFADDVARGQGVLFPVPSRGV